MSSIVVKKRRDSTTNLSEFIPTIGEVFIDITQPTLVVGDGSTAGGVPLAKQVHSHAIATSLTAGFMSTSDRIKLDALSLAGGVQTILSNTVPLPSRTIANFSTDFYVVDNPGASRTDFAISSSFIDGVKNDTLALIIAMS